MAWSSKIRKKILVNTSFLPNTLELKGLRTKSFHLENYICMEGVNNRGCQWIVVWSFYHHTPLPPGIKEMIINLRRWSNFHFHLLAISLLKLPHPLLNTIPRIRTSGNHFFLLWNFSNIWKSRAMQIMRTHIPVT